MITEFKKYNNFYKLNEWLVNTNVDQKAASNMRKCFTIIMTNWGFFADLLFNLRIVENSTIDTAATDGITIAYNPKFILALTEPECTFVILHEIMHNTLFHFDRVGSRDPKMWNYAADYAVNYMLDDMCKTTQLIKRPDWVLFDLKYADMSTEQIYEDLAKNSKGQGRPGQGGNGGPGSGQQGGGGKGELTPDDLKKPGSLSGEDVYVDDNGNPSDEQGGNSELSGAKNVDELKKLWSDIAKQAALKNQGSGTGLIDRFLRNLNKPKINWKVELKRFVHNIFNKLAYKMPTKRHIWKDEYLPGVKKAGRGDFKDVVVAIDTSGSIGDDELSMFASELKGIFTIYGIKTCHVIWCDDQIKSVQTFTDVDSKFDLKKKLRPSGGGGTSFIPPFKWVNDNLDKGPAFMIYFTDAYGTCPNKAMCRLYADRVMWIITQNPNPYSSIHFGKILLLD